MAPKRHHHKLQMVALESTGFHCKWFSVILLLAGLLSESIGPNNRTKLLYTW
ncbi:hypothetical protein DERF_000421 [Dermatophagoides farinae]|uniref:Uncharacterized protein n=1 Tax=Dermatophagoides farinae TaxID=6954 RepID=A0A922ICT2_DERFA|nr:hypothetical protein DERF_000421 [Dermatophagoides farinae]